MFVIESSSQIDKLTIHIVAKHNCSVFFWGACSFKGNGITLFCHRNPCCIGGRGILITGKCSCCICQRYGFAYLHSHCLTVDAGRCIKLVYFRENSLFEGVIGRLRGDVIHAAYGAGDRDAGCTDEAAAKAVDGFPDKELRVKLRHILCGYVNRIPVVVYGAAPFDIGDVFIPPPIIDKSEFCQLLFCQFSLGIPAVVSQSERNAMLYTIGNPTVNTLATPAVHILYIRLIPDIHDIGRAGFGDGNVVRIENGGIQPGFFGDLNERLIDSLAAVDRSKLAVLADIAAVLLEKFFKVLLGVCAVLCDIHHGIDLAAV